MNNIFIQTADNIVKSLRADDITEIGVYTFQELGYEPPPVELYLLRVYFQNDRFIEVMRSTNREECMIRYNSIIKELNLKFV